MRSGWTDRRALPSWPQRIRRAGILDGQQGGARKVEEIRQGAGGSQTEVPDPAAPRYAFLLDKALLICKRRGDSYDLKDFVNLHSFQVRDDSSGDRENKKVGSEARTGVPSAGKSQGSLSLSP